MSRSKSMLLAVVLLTMIEPGRALPADVLGKSAAEWAKNLSADTPDLRRGAAFALGKFSAGAESKLPQLLALVRDDRDAGVREAAAVAVGDVIVALRANRVPVRDHWGAAWPILRTALADSPPRVKRSAAYAIGAFGPDAAAALPELKTALLRDDAAIVRQNAAWAIGRIGEAAGAEAVNLLCDRLRDKDPLVRRDAASALGDIGLPTAAPAWKPLLELIRTEAAKRDDADDVLLRTALGKLTDLMENQNKQILSELMQLMSGNNPEKVRDMLRPAIDGVVKNLGGIGLAEATAAREAALAEYRTALSAGQLAPVLAALKKLELLGIEENRKLADLLEPLHQLLKNEDDDTARLAAFALARVGGSSARAALPVLIKALSDPDLKVQEKAATFLGEMGPEAAEAVEVLGAALVRQGNGTGTVRARAAVALSKIGPEAKRVMPKLLEVLRSEDTDETRANNLRKLVAEIIMAMGYPNNREALPTLLDVIARDPNPYVRQRCVDVFIFIDAKDFPAVRSTTGRSAEEVLTAVLHEGPITQAQNVKYDAARALAHNLHEKAPNKAIEVLLHMLNNDDLKIYVGTEAKVTNVGAEGTSGTTRQDEHVAGDARYLAAISLGKIGATANRPDVKQALSKAKDDKTDKTGMLPKEAAKALELIGGK